MDGLFASILAIYAVRGAFKGFVRSAFSLLSVIIAIILAFFLSTALSGTLAQRSFLERPICSIAEGVMKDLDKDLVETEFSSQEAVLQFLDGDSLPFYAKSFLKQICLNVEFSGSKTIFALTKDYLYQFVVKIITFLFIFILVYFAVKIVQYFIVKIVRISFFKVTSRVLGFLIGVVNGVIVFALLTIILACIGKVCLSEFLIKKIEEGAFSSIVYHKFGEKFVSWLALI